MSWNNVKLGNIITESKIESETSDPDKRITVRLNLKGVEKRPYEAGIEGATKYFIRKAGQFIYGKQNLFKGAFGIIPKELDGFESSSDIPAFDINKDCIPEWLFYFLKQGDFYLSLESIATGTGSRRIQPARLFEVEIPLPSIEEQKKIIAKCTLAEKNYNLIIKELEFQQTHLKFLRQAILQEAVQGKLTKQNKDDEPASKLLQRIKAEKEALVKAGKLKKEKELLPITEEEIPFELPKGWVWCRFAEIAIIRSNLVDPKKYLSLIQVAPDVIEKGTGKLLEKRTVKEAEVKSWNHHFFPNQIIYSKIRPNLSKAIIADFEGICSADMYPIESLINIEYLLKYILSSHFLAQVVKKDNRVKMPKINQEELNNVLIPLPPLSEQHRIVAKVQHLMQMVNELEQQVQQSQTQAQQLLQSVLKEAFTAPKTNLQAAAYNESEAIPMAAEPKLTYKVITPQQEAFLKKIVLAAHIVYELCNENTFGHTKLMKLLYLCEQAGHMQLLTNYKKFAAGPFDKKTLVSVDAYFKKNKWFNLVEEPYKDGARIKYGLTPQSNKYKQYFDNHFINEAETINKLIGLFRKAKTDKCAIVATLFYTWKELKQQNSLVNDATLVKGCYAFHAEKAKFTKQEILAEVRWMEGNRVIPA